MRVYFPITVPMNVTYFSLSWYVHCDNVIYFPHLWHASVFVTCYFTVILDFCVTYFSLPWYVSMLCPSYKVLCLQIFDLSLTFPSSVTWYWAGYVTHIRLHIPIFIMSHISHFVTFSFTVILDFCVTRIGQCLECHMFPSSPFLWHVSSVWYWTWTFVSLI